MKIHSLDLYSHKLSEQIHFYQEVLGFRDCSKNEHSFSIQVGKTQLRFIHSPRKFYYHFAFLIPKGKTPQAIDYLESRNIELLRYKDKKIIDFQTGKAIYFYDPDGNIVEFIDRPSLNIEAKGDFNLEQIIRVNEIGLPVEDGLKVSKEIIKNYEISLIDPDLLSPQFSWVGDYEGVFIVVKVGRNWLPTQKAAIHNDLRVQFSSGGKLFDFSFTDGLIVE